MGTQPTMLSISGFPPYHDPLVGAVLASVRARFSKQSPPENFTIVGTVERSAGSFSHLQHLFEFLLGWEFTFLGCGCMRWYGIVTQKWILVIYSGGQRLSVRGYNPGESSWHFWHGCSDLTPSVAVGNRRLEFLDLSCPACFARICRGVQSFRSVNVLLG